MKILLILIINNIYLVTCSLRFITVTQDDTYVKMACLQCYVDVLITVFDQEQNIKLIFEMTFLEHLLNMDLQL